jgi:hypothetical protein
MRVNIKPYHECSPYEQQLRHQMMDRAFARVFKKIREKMPRTTLNGGCELIQAFLPRVSASGEHTD